MREKLFHKLVAVTGESQTLKELQRSFSGQPQTADLSPEISECADVMSSIYTVFQTVVEPA